MISNEVVLNKMMKELQAAMKTADNHKVLLEHMANIKLLTELFLEENSVEKSQQAESARPVAIEASQISENVSITPPSIDEKDGTSIFDF